MIFNYDKKNGISTIFDNFSKTAKKQFVQVESDASKIFSKIPQDAAEETNWDDFIKKNNINSTTMQSFLKDETIPTKDLDSYISYVQQAESATSRLSGVLGTLKSVGLNALGSLATMGATMLASWAIGEIVQGIVNWIRADEIAIEKGKEATQSIQDRYDAFTKLKDAMASTEKQITGKDEAGTSEESIKKIAQRYDELHDGVNELNNANENLSTDKYQEYLDLCNQLAEQSPSLVSGYDSQGNAILNLGNTASEAEQALMRMYEASKLAANVGMGEDLQASYDGFITQIKQYSDNNEKLQDNLKELQDASDKNAQEQAKGISQSLLSISGRSVTLSNYDMDKERTLRDILGGYGILLDSSITGNPVTGEDYTFVAEGIQDLSQETIDAINKTFYDATKSSIEASGNQISADINSVQNQISSNNLFIEDQKKAITGVISNYLNTSDIFGDQNEEIQNAILANLNNLDLSVIADKYKGQIVPYIYGELIRPLKDDFSPEVQKALTDAFAIDTKNISAGEYISSLQETLSKSFNGDANKVVQWRSLLGIDDIFNEVTSGIQSVSNEFLDENGEQTLSQEQLESLYGLSLDDLRIYADLVKDGVYKTWEELQKAFEDTKKKSTPEKEDTLATLFGSEDYKADAEKYESNLSTLSSALETLRTEGSLTAEEMTNLQESFPDLTEFTTDALNEKAFKNLNDWIEKIQKGMEGMSDEGIKQAQTYIQNLIDSYGDLELSMSDVQKVYTDSQNIGSARQLTDERAYFDTRVEELRSRLASEGRELDTHVLYTIIAQDQFSGDAEAIYNAYNDAEVHWKITLENQNIEKDIEKQQAIIENESSRRSLKEAQGQTLTPDDYRAAIESAKQVARDREKQYEMALSERDKITDKESDEYKTANNAVINAEKEMLDAKANAIQTEKEGIEAYTKKYQKAVTEADNAVTEAQNAIDQAESQYGEGNADQKLYDALAKAYSQRSGAYNELSDAWIKLSNNHKEYSDEYMANALSAQSSATSDTESAKQQQGMDLQQRYNDLQADATKLQRELTVAEQKHQKVSKQTYQDLIKNGQNQIKILRKQQEEADGNIDKIREYQDQIDSMNDSIYEWGNTMENLVVDQATSLASALSTAFSESMSETGLTSDTINQLVTGFSDVLGKDFDQSDMFYATADGVKVNADALRELTEAEYELQAVDLQNEIDATREAMENAPTNTIYDSAKEKLEQLMQTQSQFFVQYEEMQKALSDYNALQIAQSTENQGAVYDSLTSTYKSMKEAYDNGFTGTDEFKAFTKLADAYGRTTTEAYEAVAPKLERYLTEDPYDGTENFLQDLKSLGFAEQDAEGAWSWRIDDLNEAAQKMGIGVELFNSMFGKLEEYDFSNYVVESLTEAQLKTQQLEMDLEQAEQTYADMFKDGASSDDLEKQKEVIDDIRDSFENIEMAKDDYLNNQAQKQKNDFMNLDNTLKMYQDMYTEATSDEERENIHEMAEREVSQYGYSLKVDSIELTDEAQADFQDRMSNISVDLSKYQQGFIQAGQGKEFNQFKEYYENNTEAAQDYLSVLSKISKEDLSKVSLSNGEYEIDPEAEDALQGLADATGFTNENMEVLLTLIGLVNDELGEIEVPEALKEGREAVEKFLGSESGQPFSGFNLDADITKMSSSALDQRIKMLKKIQEQTGVEADAYLNNEIQSAQIQLDIQTKLEGDVTQAQLKEWAEEGNREAIAKTFDIDVNSEEVDQYIEQINGLPSEYDMAIHIDDSQFNQLLSTIATGELPEAEIKVKAEDSEFQTTLQKDIDAAHTEVSTGNGVHAGGGSTTGYAYKVGSESTESTYQQEISNNTSDQSIQSAADAIKAEGEAAATATAQKLAFADANKQVAESALNTANATNQAATGVENEGEATSKTTTPTYQPTSQESVVKPPAIPQADYAEQTIKFNGELDSQQVQSDINALISQPNYMQVDIGANISEAEGQINKVEQEAESSKPKITPQVVVQKAMSGIQNFVQKVQGSIQKVSSSSPTAEMNVDNSNVEKGTSEATKDVKKFDKTSGTAKVNVDTSQAMAAIAGLRANLQALSGMRPSISVESGSINTAISRAQSLIAKLNEAAAKKVSVAAGTAHASGTIGKINSTIHKTSTPISHAYAGGTQDWTVGEDEEALVNELGQESIVRDGVWQLIPGGPHIEDLQADDILFNVQQTNDLIRTGKTARSGKLVAHANGTVPGMPALASNGGGNRNKKSSSSSKNSKSSGGNKKSNNKKSGNKKGNKKSNKNKKDKIQEEFENWLSSLFDWVEVRLDRIQRRIDLASTKAENAVGNVATAISNIDAKNQYLNDAMSEIAKSASDISQFNISVDKNNGTITGNAVEGSLLGDSILGALRYQQQANSVMDRAVNKGLLDQALANDIKGKVATGVIDINEYPEKVRKVIDAYKEWYDKGADLVQQAEELKQQYKELQQQKLDNITDHFEAWVGLADAIKASSEATVKYYTTIGQAINTKDASEMHKQLGRQQEISSQYLDEYGKYYQEMQNAVHVFGASSIEYKNAQIQLEEINKSLIESRTAEEDLRHAIAELPFTLRAQIISRIEKTVDKLSSIIQLTEKRGTVRTGASSAYSTNLNSGEFRNLYRDQMRFNNDLIQKYYEDFVARQNQINSEIKSGKLSVNSERYQELYEKLTKDQSAMISLLSTQEDLKESLRTLNWKPYEKWKTSLDKITDEFQHLQSFIREEEMYTKTGEITARGWANVAIIAEDMNIAESRITEARKALKKLGEEFNFGTISAEKYEEETTNVYEEIQKQAERLFDAQQKISEMQIEAWTRENDVLQKLIDKRSEALSAKKEYYDYDKQLREKNKDIAQINAQINALAGATDQASQAKRARLQSELKDKQQDLSDTRYDHQVDIQQQGYQKLSEDMKQALDEAVRLIQGDAATLQKTTSRMLTQLQENNINEKDIINGIVADRRTAISQETQNAINNTIGANISYLAYGLGNIASAIGFNSDKSLLQFNAAIETAINSKGENISSNISQIFSQISSINFDQKFKDLEATISKTQKTTASTPTPAASKPVSSTPAPAPTPAASKPASSTHSSMDPIGKEMAERAKRNKAAIDDLARLATSLSGELRRQLMTGRSYSPGLYNELNRVLDQIEGLGGKVKKDNRGLFVSVSYAKGTKKVNKNELAWTNENMDKVGSEMIVRPSDGAILTPLKANDAVIPANLVQNLFKWGAINPDSFAVNPFMGKWGETSGGTKSEMFSNNTSNQSINLSFDSLFHIDGNVDANVVDRLEDLGKSLTKNKEFQQNVINFVTRNYVKESRKQGFR